MQKNTILTRTQFVTPWAKPSVTQITMRLYDMIDEAVLLRRQTLPEVTGTRKQFLAIYTAARTNIVRNAH